MNTKISSALSQKIQKVADSSSAAKAVFGHLSTYTKNMSKVYVDRVAPDINYSEGEVRAVFKELEDLELGKLVLGRRGARTRFEWETPLTDVVKVGRGEAELSDEQLLKAEWKPAADFSEPDEHAVPAHVQTLGVRPATHPYRLRENFVATLVLPTDFNQKDLERLTSFLKTLPLF